MSAVVVVVVQFDGVLVVVVQDDGALMVGRLNFSAESSAAIAATKTPPKTVNVSANCSAVIAPLTYKTIATTAAIKANQNLRLVSSEYLSLIHI